jgi:hypothetical protein
MTIVDLDSMTSLTVSSTPIVYILATRLYLRDVGREDVIDDRELSVLLKRHAEGGKSVDAALDIIEFRKARGLD